MAMRPGAREPSIGSTCSDFLLHFGMQHNAYCSDRGGQLMHVPVPLVTVCMLLWWWRHTNRMMQRSCELLVNYVHSHPPCSGNPITSSHLCQVCLG